MIKFQGTGLDGVPIIGFGLSEANVQKLKEGMPVLIDVDHTKELLGVQARIVIFYGKTEEDMQEDLKTAGFNIPNTSTKE